MRVQGTFSGMYAEADAAVRGWDIDYDDGVHVHVPTLDNFITLPTEPPEGECATIIHNTPNERVWENTDGTLTVERKVCRWEKVYP